jgi:hypothetical protein
MPLRRADWFVVAVAAALVGAAAVAAWSPRAPAHAALIRSPHGERTVDLSRSQDIAIDGLVGRNVLAVRAGRLRFAAAPCRNRVCIAAGWLATAGDFAACVPNGVSVQLLGSGRDAYDAINH